MGSRASVSQWPKLYVNRFLCVCFCLLQAVFLDDLGHNLQPARAMGMATIRVRDTLTALRELERVVGVRLVVEEEEEEMVEEEGERKGAQVEGMGGKGVREPGGKHRGSSIKPMSPEVEAPNSKL